MSRTSHLLTGLAAASLLVITSSARADEISDIDRLMSAGQFAEASQKADQFLAAHPRDARMRFLKGLALSEQSRSTEAIAVFVKLTEDFPELPEPYNNLAVLYGKQGQYDQARKSLEAAIRTNPSYATAYENLGDVYAKLASQAYSRALQIDSNNAKVTPKLAMIRDLFAPQATILASAGKVKAGPSPSSATVAAAPPAKASAAMVAAAPPPAPAPIVIAAAPPAAATPAAASRPSVAPAPAPASKPPAPSPVLAAAPAPVATATTTPHTAAPAAASTASEAQAAVIAWAKAWSRKDVDAYFASYTPEFSGGKTRKAWEDERRVRITSKRSISVVLTDFDTQVKGDKATVQFRQGYSADTLKVSSRKTLEMVHIDGRWLIQKESTGS